MKKAPKSKSLPAVSPNDRWPQNALGTLYVNFQCIACNACIKEAPQTFAMNWQDGHAFTKHQPQNPRETRQALKALELCPVDAIKNDGPSL